MTRNFKILFCIASLALIYFLDQRGHYWQHWFVCLRNNLNGLFLIEFQKKNEGSFTIFGLCIYTIAINCQICLEKTTGQSNKSDCDIYKLDLDPSKSLDTIIQN